VSAYCTTADVYSWLPRGSVTRPARTAASVSTTTEAITLDDHGFADDDPITLRADSGGSLPGGLSAGTTYYAIVVTPASFQLAAAAGGAAINLTSAGSNVLVIAQLPWDKWIEEESAALDCTCPAHSTPFSTTPAIVRKYVGAMVARRAAIACALVTPALDLALRETIAPELALWRKGLAIRGTDEQAHAQVPRLYQVATSATTRVIE